MAKNQDKSRKNLVHGVFGGVFLMGLAILFYYDAFWPWILMLVGVVIIAEAVINALLG
ncbi:MAG: hypothetical protein QW775_01260 [Ignisphaera sp.]